MVLLARVCVNLNFLLSIVSSLVSIQSLVLIAVDRFGAVVFPLRSPYTHQFKAVSLLHSRHVDRSDECLFTVVFRD